MNKQIGTNSIRLRRILLLASILVLALATRFPLWKIEIWAPQYPEGLSLNIDLNQITGSVDQINILNHYIGMKRIIPSEIREFQVIPVVFLGLLIFGLVAAWINLMPLILLWLGTFLLAGAAGFADFFLWGFDYGHNLNPDAPIKIPGMSYQPPLIGHKTLLNIDSYSLPGVGTYLIFLGLGLALLGVFWDRLSHFIGRDGKLYPIRSRAGTKILTMIWISFFVFTNLSCTVKPQPIKIGVDECHSCKMRISSDRFGGEVITKKGRVYEFDSVTCMLGFLKTQKDGVEKILVQDYLNPGTLIDAKEARFLLSPQIQAPMGPGLIATAAKQDLDKLKAQFKGEIHDWESLSAASAKQAL